MEQQFTNDEVAKAFDVDEPTYLGTGSFGETWLVNGRAVKIMHNPGYNTERLEREIASHKRVNQRNVVKLYRGYQVRVGDADRAALEFEYIDGGSLSRAISVGKITSDELRGLAQGLLDGIEALHRANLLHRDIKPDNIALRSGDISAPVILDLGLAKLLDIESITRYPARIGTPMYMAPEQLRGERALKMSDLWAVGVVLYETLTGRHPFMGVGESLTIDEALARMQTGPEIPDETDADLAELILKCLSNPAYKRGTVTRARSIIRERG
ncbi:serine/threonine-protein kinase [Amycolatopsis methanolica]|uniref:serine/threonine-protein kinase n=1 Tax=Amycolatopsis methanolica TaxID=1814 RepID=UPI0034431D9F